MANKLGLEKLRTAQQFGSDYDQKVAKLELINREGTGAIDELKKADPGLGKPPGAFTQEALDALEALQAKILSNPSAASKSVRRMMPSILADARKNVWSPGTGGTGGTGGTQPKVLDLASKRGHEVFLTTDSGFAVDKNGTPPPDSKALGNALYHAGEWVQASFGSGKNLFAQPGFSLEARQAVLDQFKSQLTGNLDSLAEPQQTQLLGNVAGLLVELIKSIDLNIPVANAQSGARQLRDNAFGVFESVMADAKMSPLIKRQLVGYLEGAKSFRAQLTAPQRAKIDAMHAELNPKDPVDYKAWEQTGKDTIRVFHLAGHGEGFLYGITKHLMEEGLNSKSSRFGVREGDLKMELVQGQNKDDRSPRMLAVTVPKNHPINAWGKDMKIEIELELFSNNMMEGLGREDIDVTGYDGHSGFGRNTLRSLASMPEQKGDKLFYRYVCAGIDAESAIARRAPQAFANSYTTQDSSYFWKSGSEVPGVGKYTLRSEGWEALKIKLQGILGKKSHAQIEQRMEREANLVSHSAGNNNNFIAPGDKRHGGAGDWDNDGIPNMYDVMPTINTFDVRASVSSEFDLELPDVAANQLGAGRAFQAAQFINTATNYSTLLKRANLNRKLAINPDGAWFDGKSDPKTYVKFDKGSDGQVHVQFNSALSDMTMETLRAVLAFEASNELLKGTMRDPADLTAANLLFAASQLEYDMSFRDRAVFDGLKTLYNIPDSVDFRTVDNAVMKGEEAHDYTGNREGLNMILSAHRAALSGADVGKPAIAAYEA